MIHLISYILSLITYTQPIRPKRRQAITSKPLMTSSTRNPKPVHLLLLLLLSFTSSDAQSLRWGRMSAGVDEYVSQFVQIDDRLYAGGGGRVEYWKGSSWTQLPLFAVSGSYAIAAHKDTLYAAGGLQSNDGIVYKFDVQANKWVQAGELFKHTNAVVMWSLVTFQGQLIAGGRFSSNDGVTLSNIAAWDGTSWKSLGDGVNGDVYSMTEHEGELYVTGNFNASGDSTLNGFAKWNGTSWSAVNAPLPDLSGPLFSFKGDLILTNIFGVFSGVEVNGLAKFNGSSIESMGPDVFQYVLGLCIFDDELYISGGIEGIIPGNPQNVVMKWLDSGWQLMGSPFDGTVLTLGTYNGELIAGGSFSQSGSHDVRNVARALWLTGMAESNNAALFTVYPNPAGDQVVFEAEEKGTLTLRNQLGQLIQTLPVEEGSNPINTSHLQPGVYFLQFRSDKGWSGRKLVKQ